MAEQYGTTLSTERIGELGDAILRAAGNAGIGVAVSFVFKDRVENVYVNDVAATILGFPREELLERPALANIAPEEHPRIAELQARRTRGEPIAPSLETVIVQKNGQRVPVEVSVSHVTLQGRAATVSFFVDITGRKASERALKDSEARFRSLIEGAPDGIAITREGRFLYVNPAALRLLGYERGEELAHKTMGDVLEPEGLSAMRERVAAMIQDGKRFTPREYRATRRDGQTVTAELTSLPIEYEGRPAVIGFARDVTERRQLEAQLARADRLAALGTLAAGVAHEINNPLAFTTFTLDALERLLSGAIADPERRAEAAALVEQMREGASRVGAIVRELRAFSTTDERLGPVDLRKVVRAAERIVAHETRHRATLAIDCPSLPLVQGNEGRLEQVFVNLLLNAAQALPDGRLSENLITVRGRFSAGRVIVEVEDNGPGIPPDLLGRVFDPFFTTKPVGVGTGLGLSICHSIVTQAGGEITVESEIGQGTRFRVMLPADAVSAATAAAGHEGVRAAVGREAAREGPSVDDERDEADARDESEPREGERRARVLLIDDEPALARTLKLLLSEAHDVTAVTTGKEALDLLLGGASFDLVLCDLMMPHVTGMDIHARLVAERPQMAERLVFMTGGAFTSRAADFLKRVSNARLEKPFSTDAVEEILREQMARGARGGAVP